MDGQMHVDVPSYFWLSCLFCETIVPTLVPKWTRICLKSSQANSTSNNLILIINYGQFSFATPTPLLKWVKIYLKSSQANIIGEKPILITNYGQFSSAILL
jgi:hypothetical protein